MRAFFFTLSLLTVASCGRVAENSDKTSAVRSRHSLVLAPPHLPPQAQAVRFAEAEAALAQIALTTEQNVQLDAATEGALSKAFSALPADEAGRDRAWLLIRKAFPGRTGEQLAELLARYSKYRDALAQTRSAASDLAAEITRLATTETLQARYLGADAAALFGQQNALLRHTLELRRLELDTSLDASAKQARMQALQEQLERIMQASQ